MLYVTPPIRDVHTGAQQEGRGGEKRGVLQQSPGSSKINILNDKNLIFCNQQVLNFGSK